MGVEVLFVAFPLIAGEFPRRLEVGGPVLVAWGVAWLLLRRGKIRGAASVFIGGTWVMATYAAITAEGVRAPAYVIYLVLVTYTAFLITPAAALAVFLISLLAGLGMVLAAGAGALPASVVVHTPATLYSGYSAEMFLIVLIVLLITAEYRDAFGRLRTSEEKFRLWFEATRDPILLLDTDGRFSDGNEAAARAFGVPSRADLAGRIPANFSPELQPDGVPSLEKAERMIRTAFEQGSIQFEWLHRREDGSQFWADVALTIIPLTPTPMLMAHMRDLTERKQAQAMLARHRKAEEFFLQASTRLINLNPDQMDPEIDALLGRAGEFISADRAYVFLLREGGVTGDLTHWWNREGSESPERLQLVSVSQFPWMAARLLSGETVIISRVRDLPPEASAARAEFERTGVQSAILLPMFVGGRGLGFVGFDFVTSEETWTEETVALLQAAAAAISNALARRQSEEARRETETRFRSAFDDAPYGMAVTDFETRFLQVNRALCRLLGYAEMELLGKTAFDTTSPEDLEISRDFVRRLHAAGEVTLDTGEAVRDQGRPRDLGCADRHLPPGHERLTGAASHPSARHYGAEAGARRSAPARSASVLWWRPPAIGLGSGHAGSLHLRQPQGARPPGIRAGGGVGPDAL